MKSSVACKILSFLGMAAMVLSLASCNQKKVANPTLEVYCDQAVFKLMKAPVELYDSNYSGSKADFKQSTAAEAMAKLLAGETTAAIISRDYTPREDSLMKAHDVAPRFRKPLAQDALVLFTIDKYPIDTIDASQIEDLFIKNAKLAGMFPQVKQEPSFVVANQLSSEYENLEHFILKYKEPTCKMIIMPNTDSVIAYVKAHPGDIGIGYLSQVVKDVDLKCLMVGFADSTGQWINPKAVHQANIIQKFYPYIVTHWIYLFAQDDYLGGQFMAFLRAPQGEVQRYFLNAGIVPAVGNFNLIQQ